MQAPAKTEYRKLSARYNVPFNPGKILLDHATEAARRQGVYRHTWITNAIKNYIKRGAVACPLMLEDILGHRVSVTLRLEHLLLETLNDLCQEKGVVRSIIMIDAVISQLAEEFGDDS